MQKVDRELFLELIESPINPAFLHISTPLKHCDPMFYLQINGEALWQCRAIKKPEQMFQVLQDSLLQLGYRLSSLCKSRVGILVYGKVNYLTKKVRNATNNTSRHALRSHYWCSIALNSDDIAQGPAWSNYRGFFLLSCRALGTRGHSPARIAHVEIRTEFIYHQLVRLNFLC